MKRILMMSFLAVLVGGCGGRNTTPSPEQVPAAPKPVVVHTPNMLERAADTTWNAVKAPVEWVLPGKNTAATAPASQPAPQAAEAVIVMPGNENMSPMRIPMPPAEEPATQAATRPAGRK